MLHALKRPIQNIVKPSTRNFSKSPIRKPSIKEVWDDFHTKTSNKIHCFARMSIMDTVLETQKNLHKKDIMINFYNNFFDNHYLKDPHISPIVNTLINEGVSQNKMKLIFSDHMAMRAPTLESGVTLLRDLIQSGLWEFKLKIKSNNDQGVKNAFQITNIGGEKQLALTLCRSELGDDVFNSGQNMIPKYIFLSSYIGEEKNQMINLYQGPSSPLLDAPFLNHECAYLSPAINLSQKYGAAAPNHFTVNINELCKHTRFNNLEEVHAFLKSCGFKENERLAVKKDNDVNQRGFLGNDMYVEILERIPNSFGTFPDGFSSSSENISRIGSSIGYQSIINEEKGLNHG